jgi:hypothetical protein
VCSEAHDLAKLSGLLMAGTTRADTYILTAARRSEYFLPD